MEFSGATGTVFCMHERHTAAVVSANLKRLRTVLGVSSRSLAQSMNELGAPMSSSGITDIESGRRGVSVDQLTCIAAALGVSPITLLTPWVADGDADPDPGAEAMLSGTSPERAEDIYLWLRGDRSLTDELLDDFEREAFRRQVNPPWTWRKK
ncbi:Putative regulator or DNA-binding protein [Mycobacteroides abscessus subsp. massiliense]|uniref:HTH cro/C1-type domain-containing protein n=2 Tax=Mycobacteriaceae TaxID=1762 RepID=A0AB73LF73_MYCCH|nr:hypothetical protein BKG62_19055 [Mycobacteroides chelonae]ORV76527.1 hypothetical protein AWC10_20375 [Mycobacteroides immunogenum]SKU12050.1 Putative regulator or DNA-binding protein [Mycobacteroides abscessus subsp. massiliense]